MRSFDWKKHLRAIAEQLQKKLPKKRGPFTYVAIGDSTVEGIGASDMQHTYASLVHAGISLQFKHTEHYNLGVSGARVQDVVAGQLDRAIATQPDLITLSVGANDIVRHTSLTSFRREFTQLIEQLRSQTNAVIVVTNVPNFSLTPAVPRHLKTLARYRISRVNEIINSIARENDLLLIDAYHDATMFMRQFPKEVIYKDGFHPSDTGYALWANTILTVLRDKL